MLQLSYCFFAQEEQRLLQFLEQVSDKLLKGWTWSSSHFKLSQLLMAILTEVVNALYENLSKDGRKKLTLTSTARVSFILPSLRSFMEGVHHFKSKFNISSNDNTKKVSWPLHPNFMQKLFMHISCKFHKRYTTEISAQLHATFMHYSCHEIPMKIHRFSMNISWCFSWSQGHEMLTFHDVNLMKMYMIKAGKSNENILNFHAKFMQSIIPYGSKSTK